MISLLNPLTLMESKHCCALLNDVTSKVQGTLLIFTLHGSKNHFHEPHCPSDMCRCKRKKIFPLQKPRGGSKTWDTDTTDTLECELAAPFLFLELFPGPSLKKKMQYPLHPIAIYNQTMGVAQIAVLHAPWELSRRSCNDLKRNFEMFRSGQI